jgi:transposase
MLHSYAHPSQCRQRHRHQEYLGFLREIEKNVPETLEVHIIVDNYATHKHPRVKRWFAVRPRFHVHFTPTYASWLNRVEIWFNRKNADHKQSSANMNFHGNLKSPHLKIRGQ